MTATTMIRFFMVCLACIALTGQAKAHPHIFLDGGVSFQLSGAAQLDALNVTWRYDAFGTLYLLSTYGLSLNAEGDLNKEDWQELIRRRSDWPDNFRGSAHLFVNGTPVALDRPTDFEARLIDGQLEVTFVRPLKAPMDVSGREVEVAFYEATYFYAFSATDTPQLIGGGTDCVAHVAPFTPGAKDAELLSTLAKLGREETSGLKNVGSNFADRIVLTCG